MKLNKISAILIWSEDYQALANWYRETFGVATIEELTHPNDTGIALSIGESYLWIGKHSEVKGKNKDPFRIMFNISVDSVTTACNELKAKGISFIAEPFKSPVSQSYFATFQDLDGNVIQFIGKE
jgi:predicted enzyme related to lactoylglutathione lyase